jgi:hypothetical protein
MAISINQDTVARRGGTNNFGVTGKLSLDTSYPTGGYTLSATDFALQTIQNIAVESKSGYLMDCVLSTDGSSAQLIVYAGATAAAQTFTGTLPLAAVDLATPRFSGTGLTAAGQVITTTSTHTMTLNQCAGMWLVSATGATAPNLILSNTAVTGAPAVLTVQGSANTDAGAYKIVAPYAPVGTNASSTTGVLAQVANATNLSALTNLQFTIEGL